MMILDSRSYFLLFSNCMEEYHDDGLVYTV